MLHGSFGDLALWVDEGLAEYFELDLAQPGAEHERVEYIAETSQGAGLPTWLGSNRSTTSAR